MTATDFPYPGVTTPSISSNGNTNGILWAIEMGSTAVLHAYDASDLTDELYNSSQAANGRDEFGADTRFVTPTISHGMVYVGTPTGVTVFGLLNQSMTTTNPVTNVPAPMVLVPAFASTPFVVSGLDQLGTVGADTTYGEAGLTYTWSVISTPQGVADPAFGTNGTNNSKLIPVDITAAGHLRLPGDDRLAGRGVGHERGHGDGRPRRADGGRARLRGTELRRRRRRQPGRSRLGCVGRRVGPDLHLVGGLAAGRGAHPLVLPERDERVEAGRGRDRPPPGATNSSSRSSAPTARP